MADTIYYENKLNKIYEKFEQCEIISTEDVNYAINELNEIRENIFNPIAEAVYIYLLDKRDFRKNDYSRLTEYGSKLILYGEQLNNGYFLSQGYTILGSHSYLIEVDYLRAFDNFWNSKCALEKYRDSLNPLYYKKSKRILNNNIAACLRESHEHEKSLNYLISIAEDIDINNTEENSEINSYLLVRCNLVNSYSRMGEYEKAYEEIKLVEKYINKSDDPAYQYERIIVDKYIVIDILKGEEESKLLLPIIEKTSMDGPIFIKMGYLLKHFLVKEKYDLFNTFFIKYKEKADERGDFQIEYREIIQAYYEQVGDTVNSNKTDVELAKLYRQREKKRQESLSRSISTYVQTAKENEKLKRIKDTFQRQSEYDQLTDIPNRYKLTKFFNKILKKAIDESLYLSVEIIDIDYFKQINDNYGHNQGDLCLIKLASTIQKTIADPEMEIAARYGGDEFVIIRAGKTNEDIINCMKQLNQNVIVLAIPNEYSLGEKILTISQGAVNVIPSEKDNFIAMLNLADEGLYKAKKLPNDKFWLYGLSLPPIL